MLDVEKSVRHVVTHDNSRLMEDYLFSMESQGYHIFQGLIQDQDLLSSISKCLDVEIEIEQKKHQDKYVEKRFYDIVHHLFNKGAPFIEVLQTTSISDYADLILGDTCVVHSYNGVRLAPGRDNNATKIHRDSQRFSSQYTLSVQALVMVDEFTEENGATYLLPGSHNVARKPKDEYFYKNAVRICGQPGDVVLFNSLAWHCGGENRTSTPRRGLTIVYTRSFMKQQFDFCRSIPDDLIRNFDDKLKRLIGMNVRVPTSEADFFLPTELRLYKPNQG